MPTLSMTMTMARVKAALKIQNLEENQGGTTERHRDHRVERLFSASVCSVRSVVDSQ
jgi:hypothetical protein